ncbi:hypothetical protein GCM10028778_06910 [Barrientosiimonas marina]|uniref:DUF2929 family protein n=1 Tax=Lentibacillus kimchii TaxID=1542911 RepID=A0ABW2UV01_9BACI
MKQRILGFLLYFVSFFIVASVTNAIFKDGLNVLTVSLVALMVSLGLACIGPGKTDGK